MVAVRAGETVRLRFRGASPDGTVSRPPDAGAVVAVYGPDGARFLGTAPCAWDGRQWVALLMTDGWAPGDYTAVAEVSGPGGKGSEHAVIAVSAPLPGDNPFA